jgi:hypothetical protein
VVVMVEVAFLGMVHSEKGTKWRRHVERYRGRQLLR